MLLEKYHFDVIRGNIGEIAILAGIDWQTRGIDAGNGTGDMSAVVQACAQKFKNVVIASGEVDYISDGQQVITVHNNTKLLPAIVGSGDLLSSIVGAFSAVAENTLNAAVTASLVLSCAGERAAAQLDQQNRPGSFLSYLLDELANITPEQVQDLMKIGEA